MSRFRPSNAPIGEGCSENRWKTGHCDGVVSAPLAQSTGFGGLGDQPPLRPLNLRRKQGRRTPIRPHHYTTTGFLLRRQQAFSDAFRVVETAVLSTVGDPMRTIEPQVEH